MDCHDEKIRNDISPASTTYQHDYKKYCGYKKVSYNYERQRVEPPQPLPKAHVIEDHETFAKWQKDVHIPFDLLLQPKPILQTDPRNHFEVLEPLPTRGRDEAIKTRPRVYMTPAVSIDDVPDPNMRKLLCDFTYTTEWRKAEKEGTVRFQKHIPEIGKIETSDTVSLKTDIHKPLGKKFKSMGKSWEDQQLRGDSDPTREFWIHKDPPVVCGACVDPLKYIVPEETKGDIKSLLNKDTLRSPHDKCTPNYTGYRPMLPMGIPLKKSEQTAVDPFISTSQAIASRYVD
ncbi:unnamed protein product [Phaedon cochleariae]|uniref:Uncharacterized protein n=1 Tax=Phaedon cochleariae TaxID=80249 RepID=A0A9P0DU44_PHACE|nr:unnamed protein product [Phaedon cochleariae]